MQPVGWPGVNVVGSADQGPTAADLAQAAREFEGYLGGAMLRLGSKPLGGESLLDGGSAGRMYRELFYEEVARLAAQGTGFGIADLLRQGVREPQGEGGA